MGATFVSLDTLRYQRQLRDDFHQSCMNRAIAFEELAETWIVRDQLSSLEASAKLLLMGTGLYVDVFVQNQLLFGEQDEDLPADLVRDTIHLDSSFMRMTISDLAHGAVEVRVPLILTGYPDQSIGVIRLGFSGDYVKSKVRGYALLRAGIGFGAWLTLMLALIGIRWWLRSRPDHILNCGTLRIDTRCCEVELNGITLVLRPKLYELLLLFVRTAPELLSDQDILDALWADSTYAASPDVKQHIYLLRQQLGIACVDPKQLIVNVKGFGYRLDVPTSESRLSVR